LREAARRWARGSTSHGYTKALEATLENDRSFNTCLNQVVDPLPTYAITFDAPGNRMESVVDPVQHVEALLKKGAQPMDVESMHLAAQSWHGAELLQLLQRYGAQDVKLDARGRTAAQALAEFSDIFEMGAIRKGKTR
jgi:hypothetical protein